MKKALAFLLAVCICVTVFAGCSSTPTDNQGGYQGGELLDDNFTGYPISTTETLTYFHESNANYTSHVSSFSDLPIANFIAEATGVKIEYLDTYTDYDAAFQDIVSNGAYPDLIGFNPVTYAGGPNAAMEDGLAIPLNDIIDKYCPNLKAYLAANPDVDKAIKTDDGTYYMFPYVNSNTGAYSYGAYYRADLLEQLGAEEPTTVDGWYALLTRVKNELGITPITCDWIGLLQYGPWAMAFGVGGNSTFNGFSVDDSGKVYYTRDTAEYKAFLETMAKWYKEGLIDTDVASINGTNVNAKMINGQAFMSFAFLSNMQKCQISGASLTEGYTLKAFGTPVMQQGQVAEYTYATALVSGTGTSITVGCQNVALAARFLDYAYSEEGNLLMNYGKEGVSYEMVDGVPTFKDEVVKTSELPKDYTQSQSVMRYSRAVWAFNMVKDEDYYPQLMDEKNCREAIYIWMEAAEGGGRKHELPNLFFTDSETASVGTILNQLKTHSNEQALLFILGTRDLSQWDTYVQEIANLKAAEAETIMNAAMARYQGR